MPHYANGTEAHVGDIVKGKGYNIKDEEGNLKEIVGTLIHVTPGATACNVQVAVIELHNLNFNATDKPDYATIGALQQAGVRIAAKIDKPGEYTWPSIRIEYGQADHFEKVTG